MAAKLGDKKQSVSNWEYDNILPSVKTMIKASDNSKVSTDYPLGRENKEYTDGFFLEVTGLMPKKIEHIQQIVNDLREK